MIPAPGSDNSNALAVAALAAELAAEPRQSGQDARATRGVYFIKITGSGTGSDKRHAGEEVKWDINGSAATKTGGLTWTLASNPLYERNGKLQVPNGTLVFARLEPQDGGVFRWVFDVGGDKLPLPGTQRMVLQLDASLRTVWDWVRAHT